MWKWVQKPYTPKEESGSFSKKEGFMGAFVLSPNWFSFLYGEKVYLAQQATISWAIADGYGVRYISDTWKEFI